MSKRATNKFSNEVRRLIDYFSMEYKLTYAEAIGVLEIIKHDLLRERKKGQKKDDDDEGS